MIKGPQNTKDPFLPNRGVGLLTVLSTGTIVFLTVVVVFLAGASFQVAERWTRDLEQTAIVRLPSMAPDNSVRMIEAVETVLTRTPGVQGVERIPTQEVVGNLSGWVGDGVEFDTLPVPTLIRVRLGDAPLDVASLQSQLAFVAPQAYFEDYSPWRGPLGRSANVLRVVALSMAFLLFLALGSVIWLSLRIALLANRDNMTLLAELGATEEMIRQGLMKRYLGLMTLGAFAGTFIGVLLILLMPVPNDESALLIGLHPSLVDWLLIAAVPMAAVGASFLVIRQTITNALDQIF